MRIWLGLLLSTYACVGSAAPPEIGGCRVFTANNIWNTPIDKLPVSPASALHITPSLAATRLHPDFSQLPIYGVPYMVVPNESSSQKVAFAFVYPDESDRVLYPLPAKPVVEAGSDGHALIVDKENCVLYEVDGFQAPSAPGQPYTAISGAVYNLNADQLRPAYWTSADGAGLPVLPGLVRYDEVAAGEINHALRFTLPQTQADFVWPARHQASHQPYDPTLMPMGTRMRLKASVDISRYSEKNKVILRALKKYGMMLADNGSPWYLTGAPDPHWNDSDLALLSGISGADFEEVDVSSLVAAHDSAEVLPVAQNPPAKHSIEK